MVARDSLLNFWPAFARDGRSERGIEFDDLFASIPPEWNRLTLFDPRLPHGVKEVRGTRDPLGGRLVVHGWFVEPRPFVSGALAANSALHRRTSERLDEVLEPLARELGAFASLQGTLSVRAHVAPSGRVGRQDLLVHTLVNAADPRDAKLALGAIRHVAETLDAAEFPRARGKSQLTIPFLFR